MDNDLDFFLFKDIFTAYTIDGNKEYPCRYFPDNPSTLEIRGRYADHDLIEYLISAGLEYDVVTDFDDDCGEWDTIIIKLPF